MVYACITIIVVLAVLLTLREQRTRRIIRCIEDMNEALRVRKPVLLENQDDALHSVGLHQLMEDLNRLVAENVKATAQERSYLSTIDTTMTNLTEAVIILNEDNKLVLANPAARDLLGLYTTAEGKRVETFLHSSGFLGFIAKTKGGQAVSRQEITMPHQGETLAFEVSGAPVPPADDKADQLYLFVLHDITRLKRLEGIRREFVANVSHELRTPVTIIKGFTDTLLDDFDTLEPEDRRRFLTKIQKNVSRLHLLLEDLLTLSRLEGQQESLNRTSYSLERIIREAAENFQPKLDPKTQRLQFDLRSEADLVPVDPIKISQVFQNLLDNVFRYAKGFTHITIRTRREDNHVRVSVEDDGCGVKDEDLPLIFQRFYRVDKGRSRETGGTGLGLSIVKHMVQLHGGTVAARQAPSRGLLIEFTLPLQPAESNEHPAQDDTLGHGLRHPEASPGATGD